MKGTDAASVSGRGLLSQGAMLYRKRAFLFLKWKECTLKNGKNQLDILSGNIVYIITKYHV